MAMTRNPMVLTEFPARMVYLFNDNTVEIYHSDRKPSYIIVEIHHSGTKTSNLIYYGCDLETTWLRECSDIVYEC